MLIVRCTSKLLRRLKVSPIPSSATSSNSLGDWYATVLSVRPAHLILLVNEPTRLAALLPARKIGTLATRIPDAIVEVLGELGISVGAIDSERRAIAEVRFDRTSSRSVLGTMNDYIFMMDWGHTGGASEELVRIAMELNRTPVGPLKYERPDDVARQALGLEVGREGGQRARD